MLVNDARDRTLALLTEPVAKVALVRHTGLVWTTHAHKHSIIHDLAQLKRRAQLTALADALFLDLGNVISTRVNCGGAVKARVPLIQGVVVEEAGQELRQRFTRLLRGAVEQVRAVHRKLNEGGKQLIERELLIPVAVVRIPIDDAIKGEIGTVRGRGADWRRGRRR